MPLIVASAVFMENLDSSVLGTSLPAIARSLGESPIHLKLALTSYLLALAVCLPASGWLADRFGARTIFRLAICLFAAGSIGCGFAHSLGEIVAFRVLQGIGGSMMVPVGRLIVLRSVPKSELVGALGWVMVPAMIGPLLGPLVGGFITTFFEWRWIFWINVPIAVIGLIMASLFIPNVKGEATRRFDILGFVLASVGIAAFVSGSTALGIGVLPVDQVLLIGAGGAALILAYILHSQRHGEPILNLGLMKIQSFRTSLLGGFLTRLGIGGAPFLLPLLLQYGFGMNAFQSGAVTFVTAFGAVGLRWLSMAILRRFGFRQVLIFNTLLLALFLGLPAFFRPGMPLFIIYGVLLATGFVRSTQMSTVGVLAFVDVDNEKMSQATTLAGVFQQISFSIGISVAAMSLQFQVGPSGAIEAEAFFVPFLTLTALSLLALPLFRLLPRHTGGEVSGHRIE